MKITFKMSQEAYPIAKKVYAGNCSRQEGKAEISKLTGMTEGSAQALITIFLAMMAGETYKRAFNNETNRFLLESIRADYGKESFQKALLAAQGHVKYNATLNKVDLNGLQNIIDELQATV